MALAETAKLAVQLSLTGNFAKQIGTASRSLDKFGAKLDNTESRAYRAGQQIGTGIKRGVGIAAVGVGLLTVNVKQGLDSLIELERQQAQTAAAIKSTGGAAGVTAAQVRNLAEKYEGLNATIGDEVIQSAENLLLTFTKVRKDAFEPTLQAALDINTRLGKGPGGLSNTIRILGKALQDPLKGGQALGRLVKFTTEETDAIAGLYKWSKKELDQLKGMTPAQKKQAIARHKQAADLKAQAAILKIINDRFGGSFLAEGGTTGAKVKKFYDSIEDLQRLLAAGLLPVVSNVADALTELFQDEGVKKGVEDFGKQLGDFLSPEKIKSGIGAIKDIFSTIAAVAGPAASAIGLMVSAFSKLPDWARNVLIGAFVIQKGTGGLLTNLLGGLKDLVVGKMNVQAGVVSVTGGGGGGVPGGAAPAAAGKGGLSALGKVFLIGEAIGLVAAVNEVRSSIEAQATQQATEAHATQSTFLKGNPSDAAIASALAGVNTGIRDLQNDPLAVALVSGPALTELQAMRAELSQALFNRELNSAALQTQRAGERTETNTKQTKAAIDASKATLSAQITETTRETTRGVTQTRASANAIQNTTRSSVLTGAQIGASATLSASGAIIGALYATRTQVNVTSVTKTINNTVRYGAVAGSQGTNSDSGGNTIGH